MEFEKSFYEIAEEDFEALDNIYNNLRGYNGIGALAQNTIEKYLKHIMHTYIDADDMTKQENLQFLRYSRSHDICSINDYLIKNDIDLQINGDDLEYINNYYFTTRYPEEYETLTDEDKTKAYELCLDVKNKVSEYLKINDLNKGKTR